MTDKPTSFRLPADVAAQLRKLTDERGCSVSQVVRYALDAYESVPTVQSRGVGHTARLSPQERVKLDSMASLARVSKSKALALLVARAVADLADVSPEVAGDVQAGDVEQLDQLAKVPGRRAFKTWARLILEAAQLALKNPSGRKAWIGPTIDLVASRVQTDRPDDIRAAVRALLPALAQRGLLRLTRCDLPAVYPRDLVESSEIEHIAGNTEIRWHFIQMKM